MTTAVVGVRPSPHRVQSTDGEFEAVRPGPNTADLVALEAARAVADDVVAVGVGGDDARHALRGALRYSADRAVQVRYDPIEPPVAERFADALATMAAREAADVVLLGNRSPLMGPETSRLVGTALEAPAVTGVTAVGADEVGGDSPESGLLLRRRLAPGTQEELVVERPVVLGIDAGYANPQRAPLDAAIDVQQAGIESVPLDHVLPGESRFSMSIGNSVVSDVRADDRWGQGDPPRSGTTEERIAEMLGRTDGTGATGGGELVDRPTDEAVDAIVAYLERHELV